MRVGRSSGPSALALILLMLGAVRHYGYELAPPALHARVWNVHAAMVMLVLVTWGAYCAIRLLPDGSPWAGVIALIAAWWIAEEALVIGCNVAWMARPWPLVLGQSACYPLWHFDLGKIGAALMALALWRIVHLARKVNL